MQTGDNQITELTPSVPTKSVSISLSTQVMPNLLPDFGDLTEQENVASSRSPFIQIPFEPVSADPSKAVAELIQEEIRTRDCIISQVFQRSQVLKKSLGHSIIYDYRVKVQKTVATKTEFLCPSITWRPRCAEVIRVTSNITTVTKHLKRAHRVNGRRAKGMNT